MKGEKGALKYPSAGSFKIVPFQHNDDLYTRLT